MITISSGTAIFAMCTMIDRCLSLIQMLETYINNPGVLEGCRITFVVSIVAKICAIIFIFAQSFFIFKYANIIINYGKNSAVIGLMHIVCTNFCVFFRTVVFETVAEIRHHNGHVASKSDHGSSYTTTISAYDTAHNQDAYLHGDDTSSRLRRALSKTILPSKVSNATGYKAKQLGCINSLAFKHRDIGWRTGNTSSTIALSISMYYRILTNVHDRLLHSLVEHRATVQSE